MYEKAAIDPSPEAAREEGRRGPGAERRGRPRGDGLMPFNPPFLSIILQDIMLIASSYGLFGSMKFLGIEVFKNCNAQI